MPVLSPQFSRRDLLSLIGKVAGGGAAYQAMSTLGYAQTSDYRGPLELSKAKKQQSVVILGAGLAGMTAAYELSKAGYRVQILEFQNRAGGRNWTVRGGDEFTDLAGFKQKCEFDKGNYINPGPWRIPYNHYAVLDYCKRFGVKLELFNQVNYNALVHNTQAFGGKPKRFREVQADSYGYTAELLAKAMNQGALDQAVTKEDKEKLLESLRTWGALDKDMRYQKGLDSAVVRGYDVRPGGGLMPLREYSTPIGMKELFESGLWNRINDGHLMEFQSAIFEPVGGMDMIGKAFEKQVGKYIRFNSKITKIEQNDKGVTVTYEDTKSPGHTQQVKGDYCICTIPVSILAQIEVQCSDALKQAIDNLPYGAAFKIGLEFKRRFWEEDEQIYGGISYTDQAIEQISYPSNNFFSSGSGVLLGGYNYENTPAYEFTAMSPKDRIEAALEQGSKLHPQYRKEFKSGFSVGWHRVPWINGCFGLWTDQKRDAHYKNMCAIDNRLVLAGEHCSYIPAWQEGAILSSLDAVKRLHEKAQATS